MVETVVPLSSILTMLSNTNHFTSHGLKLYITLATALSDADINPLVGGILFCGSIFQRAIDRIRKRLSGHHRSEARNRLGHIVRGSEFLC